MPKLIPLSSKRMKEMGIVKSKNGFLMQPVKEKKSENNKLPSKPQTKPDRYVADKAPKEHKEPVRQSNNNNHSVSRIDRKQEAQRLADRGIY